MNKFRAYLIQEEKSELAKGERILLDVVNYGMMEKNCTFVFQYSFQMKLFKFTLKRVLYFIQWQGGCQRNSRKMSLNFIPNLGVDFSKICSILNNEVVWSFANSWMRNSGEKIGSFLEGVNLCT